MSATGQGRMSGHAEANVEALMGYATETAQLVQAGKVRYEALDPAAVPEWAKAYILSLETALKVAARSMMELAKLVDKN